LRASRGGPTLTGVTDRLAGALLFLPVPLVLWLFTRAPFGVVPSLLLGIVVMASHRLYARPFALRRAGRRCLWCGAPAAGALRLAVVEPPGESAWSVCSERHRESLLRALGMAQRWAVALRIGIGGGLVVFLPVALLAGAGVAGAITFDDAVAFFRLAVAASVLPFAALAAFVPVPSGESVRVPFAVHIQALIGTWAVLWLFRIIGLLWLVQGIRHLAIRL